jgi:DNA-binding NarL/FixJ family response regulator
MRPGKIRAFRPQTGGLIFTMYAAEPLPRAFLEARGYLLKSDARLAPIMAVEALAGASHCSPSGLGGPAGGLSGEGSRTGRRALVPRARVVQLIVEGHTNKSVAELLGVNLKTVESHRTAVMRKINVHSAADLVRYAIHARLAER